MKKNFSIVLISLLLVIGVSCSGKSNENKIKDLGAPSVIHITESGGVDDNSFNASIWKGINKFYKEHTGEYGVHYSYLTTPSLDLMETNLSLATEEHKTLVVAAGFNFIESMRTVASRNPDQLYLLVDGPDLELENVKSTYFADEQSAFLVGALAALKSIEDKIDNPVFGFIGGMPNPVITRFEIGYLQGIKYILGNDVLIVSYYADDWANPAKAKTMTQQWINQYPSLYAIFSAAGPTGNGTIAQVKESVQSGRNVWAIGVDSDQYEAGLMENSKSVVLTSAMKNIDEVTYNTLNDLKNGKFETGLSIYTLINNGVGYSITNKEAISLPLIDRMNIIIEAIKNNEIFIYSTLEDVRTQGLADNYITDAADGF